MCCNSRAKACTAALAVLENDSLPFPIRTGDKERIVSFPSLINIAQVKIDVNFTMCFSSCARGDLVVERG